jgi:hypothetical protein
MPPGGSIKNAETQHIAVHKGGERAQWCVREQAFQQSSPGSVMRRKSFEAAIGSQGRLPIRIAVVPFEPSIKRLGVGMPDPMAQPPDGAFDPWLIMPLDLPHGRDVEIGAWRKRGVTSIQQRQLAVTQAES